MNYIIARLNQCEGVIPDEILKARRKSTDGLVLLNDNDVIKTGVDINTIEGEIVSENYALNEINNIKWK